MYTCPLLNRPVPGRKLSVGKLRKTSKINSALVELAQNRNGIAYSSSRGHLVAAEVAQKMTS